MREKRNIIILFGLLLLLYPSCQRAYLDKQEAVNCIENLKMKVNQLSSNIMQSEFAQIIDFYRSIDSPSLYMLRKYITLLPDINKHKGVYLFNKDSASFIRKNESDSLQLIFNTHHATSFSILISDFKSKNLSVKSCFPMQCKMELLKDDTTNATLNYRAKANKHYPSSINVNFQTALFDGLVDVKYKQWFRTGIIDIKSALNNHSEHIEQGEFKIKIKHYRSGYSIKKLYFKIRLYDVILQGNIHHGKIDPGSENYEQEFNKNSKIFLETATQNRLIGKVILMPVDKTRKLDYYIQFADKTYEPVRTYFN